MPLIVLCNRHILHALYTDFTAPKGARLCYFPESNAKALLQAYQKYNLQAGFAPGGRWAAFRRPTFFC